MTTIDIESVNCPICKKDFEIRVILSTNCFNPPDLDLRPGEMQRSTMDTWTQECPYCGYVASNFDIKPTVTRKFIESDKYLSCDNTDFKNKLSEIFYRQYLIADDDVEKFNALLFCAWACDDAEDEDNAISVREKCLKYIDSLDSNDDMLLRKADILRRSKHFDELIEEFSDKKFDGEIYSQICSFQIQNAMEKDNKCYTVKDVVDA